MSDVLTPIVRELGLLQTAYNEPHRKYHNMDHIVRMFQVADELDLKLSPVEVLAIWWHDYVYAPGAEDNEEASAKAMKEISTYYTYLITEARNLILDTKSHIPDHHPKSGVIIDLDLWDLGTDRYQKNSELIYKEFSPYVGEEAFQKGRIMWLKKMLKRDSIFVSDIATLAMERLARQNMREELERLELIKNSRKESYR